MARRVLLLAMLCLHGCATPPAPAPVKPTLDEVTTVPARIGTVRTEVTAAGNLSADPARQGQVGSPASARVVELYVTPGEKVKQGQPLAKLQGAELTRARSDYQDACLRLKLATRTLEQRREMARLGDATRRPVEEARNELITSEGEEEIAASARRLAAQQRERARTLERHGIASRQQVEEAEAAWEQADARWRQARQSRRISGLHRQREERLAGSLILPKILEAENEAELAQEEVTHTREVLNDLGLAENGGDGLILRAPRSGIVTACHATLGQAVAPDEPLFEVLDPSRLWLSCYLYEKEQRQVNPRMPVTVEVAGHSYQGRIAYLPPQLELPSRALKARVVVENPHGRLRVGMTAKVRVQLKPPHEAVTIPRQALLEGNCVYVKTGSEYLPRTVVPGATTHQDVEVARGLKAGEQVVVEGAELLRAGQ